MERKFRPEIEGLRAIAALLVAFYHIWLDNVSGGIDVFFVVSGFLITTSLLNRYERTGKIDFFSYILNLAKRLFPLAFTVLFFTTIASILFLPQILWLQTLKEIIASALYIENWQLARNAVDYLAQNNEASPVQHFWAMSVQWQFYFIWPILLIFSIILAKYIFKKTIQMAFLITLISVFSLSLIYSIYLTAQNQPWAYFDTFTRVWEFGLGGIIALIISKISLQKSISTFMGWLGLIGLISCGMILQVGNIFPGYAALWPTLCAVFIILAGNQGGSFGVHRLLSNKLLVQFGGISYGFYLWHWPILIFYFTITGFEQVNVLHGLMIIIASIVLSYLSTNFIEKPYRTNQALSNFKITFFSVCFAMPVLMLSVGWYYSLGIIEQPNTVYANEDYPGARVFASNSQEEFVNDFEQFAPTPLQVRNDLPIAYFDGCHQVKGAPEMIKCDYGATEDWTYTVALVGGSHALQWLPALLSFAEEDNIKVVNYTKAECRFTLDEDVTDDCALWNEDVINSLTSEKPDLVFTNADVGKEQMPTVPTGYLAMWKLLEEANMEVFGIRDNPWMGFDIPYCVDTNGATSDECIVERDKVILSDSPWSQLAEKPANVHYTDLNDYICDEDYCNPVEGNVLVYRDDNHLSASYSTTLGPIVRDHLMPILEDVVKRDEGQKVLQSKLKDWQQIHALISKWND